MLMPRRLFAARARRLRDIAVSAEALLRLMPQPMPLRASCHACLFSRGSAARAPPPRWRHTPML